LPFDEISSIKAAEDEALQIKLRAQADSAAAEEAAESSGAAALSGMIRRAEEEAVQLLAAAEEKAAEFSEKLRRDTADERTGMRAEAAKRMDAAADIIVKKVVEG